MSTHADGALTRRDAIAQQLRDEIVSGALRPGAVIKDAELAARLGYSITPVREALTQLAMEGLVEMPPNRAKRIAPLTRRTAVELMVVLRLLSVAAFEDGVRKLTPDDLQTMRAAYATMVAAIVRDARREASTAGRTFADIVIRAAGNHEIRRLLAMIVARSERLVLLHYQEGFAQVSREMHGQILAALERGDHAAALAAYREQLDRFQQIIEALPDDAWDVG